MVFNVDLRRLGDFFQEVPSGGDAYLLKQVLHDWSDERCHTILMNCRRVMTENGRLLVFEAVIESGAEASVSKLFDLHLLVTSSGGRERTASEFQSLFQEAGFELLRIMPTPSSFRVIEGRPV